MARLRSPLLSDVVLLPLLTRIFSTPPGTPVAHRSPLLRGFLVGTGCSRQMTTIIHGTHHGAANSVKRRRFGSVWLGVCEALLLYRAMKLVRDGRRFAISWDDSFAHFGFFLFSMIQNYDSSLIRT